jgi:hypothetical protein
VARWRRSGGGESFEVNLLVLMVVGFCVIYGVAALFNLLLQVVLS